jgi:hypothetical protein
MLWDKAGKDKIVNPEHYDTRICTEGALPSEAAFNSGRKHGMFSSRTDSSLGSDTETSRERERQVLQDNLDSANVAFYNQGPKQEEEQHLGKEALKERIRLSGIHERRTKHEARIIAGAETEAMKKNQKEQRRLKGIARSKLQHLALANEREERCVHLNKKKCDISSHSRNFGASRENSTLPGLLHNKENINVPNPTSTYRSGLSTARLVTGGAIGGGGSNQRNSSSLHFNDYS